MTSSSSTTSPTELGFIAWVTMPPTATSLSPNSAAFTRSTRISMNGCSSDRLELASATTSIARIASSTVSVASARSSLLAAVMLISTFARREAAAAAG